MRICIVTHVCSDRQVAERSFASYGSLGYPIFWVCFNPEGLEHARSHFSRERRDAIVDYSQPPYSDLFLNEASYLFFREFGAFLWSSFDIVALPQDDVAYGAPEDLSAMARIIAAEGILLAMPSFPDDGNLTMPHVASQRTRGVLRRYSTFVEELGWIVNTHVMPREFFTLAYCFSKSSWGKEFFLCSSLIRRFGPFACAIFDQFPAKHLRTPLSRHGDVDANHLYRKLKQRFGIQHPGASWGKIKAKEHYLPLPVDLAFVGEDGRKRMLVEPTTTMIAASADGKGPSFPIHPDYWLPSKYSDEASLRRLLETDPDHIDYRSLDRMRRRSAAKAVATLSAAEFERQFGAAEVADALHGSTASRDTAKILALLRHADPKSVLEIGVAEGHMIANFAKWTSEDARIFGIGLAAESKRSSLQQAREDPLAAGFGRLATKFGGAGRIELFESDSATFDFGRIGPIDFAFIDGARDFEHVRSDSRNAYAILKPGGYLVWHDFDSASPWIEARRAIESLPFPEPVHHIEGTEVAFLRKDPDLA